MIPHCTPILCLSLTESGECRVQRDNLSLPSGVQKVPIGVELPWINKFGIIRHLSASWARQIGKNISVLFVYVAVLPAVPFGFIDNLRQNEGILDWIQGPTFIKDVEITLEATIEHVGDVFPGSPFRPDPGS